MHTGKVANLIGFKIEDVYLPSMTLFFNIVALIILVIIQLLKSALMP